jgi:hypothetical protein
MCKNATPTECKVSEDATLEELAGTLGMLLPSSTVTVVSTVAALLDSGDLVASSERFVFMLAPEILYAPPPPTHLCRGLESGVGVTIEHVVRVYPPALHAFLLKIPRLPPPTHAWCRAGVNGRH